MNRNRNKPFESSHRTTTTTTSHANHTANKLLLTGATTTTKTTRATKKATSGKINEIIDFSLKGKSRYMKINQPVLSLRMTGTRSSNRFKNPRLSAFDYDGDEEYEPKQFVFDIIEVKSKPPAPPLSILQQIAERSRDHSQDTSKPHRTHHHQRHHNDSNHDDSKD